MPAHSSARAAILLASLAAAACSASGAATSHTSMQSTARANESPAAAPAPAAAAGAPDLASAARAAKDALKKKHGAAEAARVDRGVDQAASLWRAEDGDAAAFQSFCEEEFLPRGATLDETFRRLEYAFERIDGYHTSLSRDLKSFADVEVGPVLPIDGRLAGYSPSAHVADDLFGGKIAFVVLLNFPVTTLAERLERGMSWSRRDWSEARLTRGFETRTPAAVLQQAAKAYADAEAYIAGYYVRMGKLVAPDGSKPFPSDLRLITHWNLRDDLKARYAEPDGLAKQRMIAQVMERIVRQEIPAVVIDNPSVEWTPSTNAVSAGAPSAREADVRYQRWLDIFRAERLADPYDPAASSHVRRRFDREREIPEDEVTKLLESVLASPLGASVAALIEKRLGRPLEPFDVWYAGFKPRGTHTEAELDAITKKRYPAAEAYAADIPRLLKDLGFSEERARWIAARIVVDPSRGAGHASGPRRRDDAAHLRTHVAAGGMDYKGYNIAVHEMGHNVEQVFSTTAIDHSLLSGVPNTAFTEALAFVFQARDLELLGLEKPDANAEHLRALEDFWATREIAGVALVDMAVWRWLYEHPDASAAQLREAVVSIAKETWNRWYAPIFKVKDVALLAIYSHMVDAGMYTPDYPLGHLIAFQVDAHFRKQGKLGEEFERVAKLGSITPDAWMRQAVGAPLSSEPLLKAAAAALEVVKE